MYNMDGEISALPVSVIGSNDKTMVTITRRHIQTLADASSNADVAPAVRLLVCSRKCAAMYACLTSSSKRCPAGVRHLIGILSPLLAMMTNIKCVVRNSKGWVSSVDQQEALELMELHLEQCQRVLLSINTEKNAESSWPAFKPSKTLEERMAAFTAKCNRGGRLAWLKKRQPAAPKTCCGPSRYEQRDSGSVCSTAALSDDATHPPSPMSSSSSSSSSPSPSSSSPSSPLSFSSLTFAGSENIAVRSSFLLRLNKSITIRPSSASRWRKMSEAKGTETSPPPTPPTTTTHSLPVAEGPGLRRRNKHLPVKASALGTAFVPYRSPARLAGPRGTSLRGSGAISTRNRRFW